VMPGNRYRLVESASEIDQLCVGTTLRKLPILKGSGPVMLGGQYRAPRFSSGAEYMAIKATLRPFVEELKEEIQSQHERTRAEVRTARSEILIALKSSPAEFIELVCEFGLVVLLFSLVVRFTLNLELVNTAFAIFMLFALALYWSMAKLKRRSQKRRSERS